MSLLLDTGGLVTLLDRSQRDHAAFVEFFERWQGAVVSTEAVLTEASHLLGRMARALPQEWERVYKHPVHFVETFVHSERFRGTCYRAANWVLLGHTTGRGKDDLTHRANRPIKDVLGLPLCKGFRRHLCTI